MHSVQLEAFNGPLDLLFSLIETNKVDIYDIPIVQITQQYLEAIRKLPPDMESLSEFLVLAATLLDIKARMLLPRQKLDDDEIEDPREALVQKLIAYKYCQDLAAALKEVEDSGRRLFKSAETSVMSKMVEHQPEAWLEDINEDYLLRIFKDVMQRQVLKVDTVRHNFGTVVKERFTLADKMNEIVDLLRIQKKVLVSVLFEECISREECITTFLALLEIIKVHKAEVIQQELFGEIELTAC